MSGILCSVLIPTRGRPEGLRKAIQSVVNTALNINRIEIRLRMDSDDAIGLADLCWLIPSKNVSIHIGPRLGYNNINRIYAEIANASEAQWIWVMNDDAYIVGSGWDHQLNAIPKSGFIVQPELYQLNTSRYRWNEGGAFPLVPNGSWKKFLGSDDMPAPIDVALDKVLRIDNGWQTHFLKGISVIHDRPSEKEIAQYRL